MFDPETGELCFLFDIDTANEIWKIEGTHEQRECFKAVTDYGLYGKEPETDDPIVLELFRKVKPNIDSYNQE